MPAGDFGMSNLSLPLYGAEIEAFGVLGMLALMEN